MAGAATLANATIDVKAKDEKLPEKKAILSGVDFGIKEPAHPLPLISNSTRLPFQQVASKNKSKHCLGMTSEYQFNFNTEDKIVITHDGVRAGSQSEIQFDRLVLKEGYDGDSLKIKKTDSPRLSVDKLNKHRLTVSVGDSEISVKKGESTTASYQETISPNGDQRDVDIAVSAEHFGKVKIISHPNNHVFPKTPEWERYINEVKKEAERTSETTSNTVYEIIEHPNGYEYNVTQENQ